MDKNTVLSSSSDAYRGVRERPPVPVVEPQSRAAELGAHPPPVEAATNTYVSLTEAHVSVPSGNMEIIPGTVGNTYTCKYDAGSWKLLFSHKHQVRLHDVIGGNNLVVYYRRCSTTPTHFGPLSLRHHESQPVML